MLNGVVKRVCGSRAAVVAVVALALAAVGGCGGDADGPGTAGPASATAPPASATARPAAPVTVWFSDDQGHLRSEEVEVPAGTDRLRAALDALAAGPSDARLLPALPPGTRVLAASSEGGVATVDLSAEFESGYPPGGAAAELAVVAPLVRTAAGASGASRVLVRVDGRAPAPTGSQLDFTRPLSVEDLPAP